jgi:hypothetical protein
MDELLVFGVGSAPFAIVAFCVSDFWCGVLVASFVFLSSSVYVVCYFDPVIDSQGMTPPPPPILPLRCISRWIRSGTANSTMHDTGLLLRRLSAHTQYYDSHKLQRIAELTRGGHKGSIRYVVAVIGILGTLGVSWGWLLKTIL